MDVATEEIGHVEMLATMVARLRRPVRHHGQPYATRWSRRNRRHGRPAGDRVRRRGDPRRLSGTPWNASTSWPAATCRRLLRQRRRRSARQVQTARLYAMTDDPVSKKCSNSTSPGTPHRTCGWPRSKAQGRRLRAPSPPARSSTKKTGACRHDLGCPLAALPRSWMQRTARQPAPPALPGRPNRWADRLPSRRPATRCTGRSRVLPAKARRKAPSVPRGRGKASPTKSKTPSTRRCPAAEPQDSAAAPPGLLRSAAARSAVRTVRGAVPGHLW